MAETTYPLNRTGLIVVDATNDFIPEGGKRAVDVTAAYRPEHRPSPPPQAR